MSESNHQQNIFSQWSSDSKRLFRNRPMIKPSPVQQAGTKKLITAISHTQCNGCATAVPILFPHSHSPNCKHCKG